MMSPQKKLLLRRNAFYRQQLAQSLQLKPLQTAHKTAAPQDQQSHSQK